MAKVNTDEVYQWQLTKKTVSERIKHLYNNPLMADVNFVVADKQGSDHPKVKIPCHKIVLAVSSPVFFAMFYGELQEISESIELPDCDSEGLLEFLRYIYCDDVRLTGSCVMQVLYLAKKYMIPSLTSQCRSFLEANINAENVLDVLPLVDKLEEAHLTGVCWKVVDAHTEKILPFSSATLLEEHEELVASMLSRDTLNASEVKIFQAVNRWAKDICTKRRLTPSGKEKRKVIGETILKLIRFPLMLQQEFAEQVPNTNILKKTEVIQMFMYFNLNKKPGEFSCIPRCPKSSVIHRCKRFDGSSCFWYYNRGSVDSISFTVDIPVLLRGVRLFGFRGETYFVKVKVCGETVLEDRFQTETEEKDGYYGFDIIFEQCRQLNPGVPCVLEALISGPKSHYGISGEEEVVCDKVTFRFDATHNSQNGSSVSRGQFAEILFTYSPTRN
ncbi:BTB/POZ domain-containing protein 3-like [Oculina patagonica]